MVDGKEKRIMIIGGWPDAHMLGLALATIAKVGIAARDVVTLLRPPTLTLTWDTTPDFQVNICQAIRNLERLDYMAAPEIDLDPRPLVARDMQPKYHDPRLLRMDANSRKYQSTQVNWRKFAGQHHKKKKIIR